MLDFCGRGNWQRADPIWKIRPRMVWNLYISCSETINPEELRWSLREGHSLVLVLLDIYKYRSMPLDETALE